MDDEEIKKAIEELHKTKIMFGSPDAPFWFVGLEEANGGPQGAAYSLIENALSNHRDFGKNGYLGLRKYTCSEGVCPEGCHYKRSKKSSSYLPCLYSGSDYDAGDQKTWRGYIKLLISLTHGDFTLDEVKKYQKYHLGDFANTPNSIQSALLELFPMHCKRGDKVDPPWPYGDLSKIKGMEHFETSKKYWDTVKDNQWQKLLSVINKHEPRFVYLAGASEFANLLGNEVPTESRRIDTEKGGKHFESLFGKLNSTTVVTGQHPVAWSVTNAYWRNLAAAAASYENFGTPML